MAEYVDVLFDDRPGPVSGRFMEVELPSGHGTRIGEWIEREDGYWALRIRAGAIEAAGNDKEGR